MHKLKTILGSFSPITLAEMDAVKLMDRTDTKFFFNHERLPALLESLRDNYRVLNINETLISKYETLYFDTANFMLYHHHHSGHLNRHKIRYRKYVESGLNYFEIKFKNNKGRTIKNRIKRKEIQQKIKGKAKDLLKEITPLDAARMEPKLWVNYSRITLVNKISCERVTIDLHLNFKNQSQDIHLQQLVIAEVKQDKSNTSPFINLMKQHHLREGGISKYCMAAANLYTQLKRNNFKEKLLNINKLCYGTTKTIS